MEGRGQRALRIGDGRKVLFKIHGSAENEVSVVMTRREYDDAAKDVPYQRIMSHLLQSYTFLLVGYGINDPLDLDLVFGLNAGAFGSATRTPLRADAQEREPRHHRDRWQRDMNIQVVPYDDHGDLPASCARSDNPAKPSLSPSPPASLAAGVAFSRLPGSRPRPRGSPSRASRPTGRELFGRDAELAWLDACWQEGVRVASIVAFGGVGKSALVNAWLARMDGCRVARGGAGVWVVVLQPGDGQAVVVGRVRRRGAAVVRGSGSDGRVAVGQGGAAGGAGEEGADDPHPRRAWSRCNGGRGWRRGSSRIRRCRRS